MTAPLLLPPSPHNDGNASAITDRVHQQQFLINDLQSFSIVAWGTLKVSPFGPPYHFGLPLQIDPTDTHGNFYYFIQKNEKYAILKTTTQLLQKFSNFS